jgi:signal transduction histidine kinase/CheY-like chemotaxis protein
MMPQKIRVAHIDIYGQIGNQAEIDDYVSLSVLSDTELWVQSRERVGILASTGIVQFISLKDMLKGAVLSDFLLTCLDPGSNILWVWNNDILSALRRKNGAQFELLAEKPLKLVPFSVGEGVSGAIFINTGDGIYCSQLSETRFDRILWQDASISSKIEMREARGMLEASNGDIYMFVGNFLYRKKLKVSKLVQAIPARIGISCLSEDLRNNSIWFGSLHNYNPGTEKSVRLKPDLFQNQEKVVWSSCFISKDTLILGMSEGLSFFCMNSDTLIEFDQYNEFRELQKGSVYHFHRENDSEWWLLSDKGLFILNKKYGVTAHYSSSRIGKWFLPADNLRHCLKDSGGIYWFATAQGLLKWNVKSGVWELITTDEGLPNNNLYAVYKDENGFLWLSSDYGIIQYHPGTGTIRYYLEEDGVTSNEFNRISHLKTSDGAIYFGSINGITAFRPGDFGNHGTNQLKSEVVIMSVRTMSENDNKYTELLPAYHKKGKIVLDPDNGLLQIGFAMPEYSRSKEVVYSYRIEGLNEGWVYTKTPLVQLVGLSPGAYTLVIKAKSGSGNISENECRVRIEVLPHFYQQWWFLLLAAGVVFLLLLLGLKYRESVLIARQKELEEKISISTEKIRKDKELIEYQAAMLSDKNEAQRRFFSNITHEFRTPLSLIRGPIDIVRRQSGINRRFRSLLDIAHSNSGRLLDLVDSILMVSSLDVQGFRRRDTVINIKSCINSISGEYIILADQKKLEFQTQCNLDEDVCIVTDLRIFRIIIDNLLSNAMKFTPPGGRVILAVNRKSSPALLEISVSDTGRGIHPEDLSRIFDRYFQTGRPDAPLEGGTGIGLSLVKELTEMMGGSVEVSSVPGRGSQFYVQLPLVIAPEADRDELVGNQKYSRKKMHRTDLVVMLVEDNTDFQQYISFILNDCYQVVVAGNGMEALALLDAGTHPHLIITDWMMPEMDGRQLAQRLKSDPVSASIPLVFLTARSGNTDMEQVVRLGIDDYLIKPFDETVLLVTVEELVKRYSDRLESETDRADVVVEEDQLIREREWLESLQQHTNRDLSDELFSVDQLASLMLMGRTSFYKEVKRLTGLTPNEYILEARLTRARHLMETRSDLTLKKVVQLVGLKDEGNFSRAFKKRFGQPPSWYL